MKVRDENWYDRGYLPHFHDEECPQSITLRLADSLPVAVYKRITASAVSEREKAAMVDRCLDSGRGRCLLERPTASEIVREAILWSDGRRFDLKEWVIMPNHVHISYTNAPEPPTITAGKIKSFTANRLADEFDDVDGQVWQRGVFDRYIRGERHAFNLSNYFWFNPVRAGLAESPFDWEFSSIHDSPFEEEELRRWFERHREHFWECWY